MSACDCSEECVMLLREETAGENILDLLLLFLSRALEM